MNLFVTNITSSARVEQLISPSGDLVFGLVWDILSTLSNILVKVLKSVSNGARPTTMYSDHLEGVLGANGQFRQELY